MPANTENLRLLLTELGKSKPAIELARHQSPEVHKGYLIVAAVLKAIRDCRAAGEHEIADDLVQELSAIFVGADEQ